MIRIFVGTPANNEDLECQAVLDHSLRKHASEPLDITYMMLSRDPQSFWSGWNARDWVTPFSALRWGVPAACNYEGRAIYMDCDTIAKADIAELHKQDIPDGKAILAKVSRGVFFPCVMLFDCARMRDVSPPMRDLKLYGSAYTSMSGHMQKFAAPFDGDWNCRDGEGCQSIDEPHVKLVHYTHIPTQPNHRHARERLKHEGNKPHWYIGQDVPHPRADITKLFDDMLAEAIAAGRGPEAFRVANEFGPYGR